MAIIGNIPYFQTNPYFPMIFWSHHQRCRGQKKAPKLRSWWQDGHPQQQRIIPKPHPSTTSTYDCNDLFNTLKCIASEIVVSVIAGIGSIHGLRFQWWMEPICRISQNLLTPQSVHFVFIDRYGSYKKRQVLGFFLVPKKIGPPIHAIIIFGKDFRIFQVADHIWSSHTMVPAY